MKTSLPFKQRISKKHFRFFTILSFVLFGQLFQFAVAQSSQTFNANGTFTVPAGVTQITVECWGGGGKGGTRTNNGAAGGGGGGGYSRSVFTVIPNNNYTVRVGAGSGNTNPGGDSWFNTSSTILARGGNSVANNDQNGATGAAVGIGDVTYAGGDGADGNYSGTRYGGGGGSSAGSGSDGTTATGQAGANAPTDGGDGGNGRNNTQGGGSDGRTPGGGGGGALRTSSSTRNGGDGANGRVVVSWVPAYAAQFISMDYGSNSWCAGETRNVTVTVKNIGQATWTNSSPDINVGVKWNQNGTSWADYYVRTDANNVAPGATTTFTLPLTASNFINGIGYTTPLAAGTNRITFDMVAEGLCWFANNTSVCGPGNAVFASPNLTITANPQFTQQPSTTPQVYCQGDAVASLSINHSGSATYQWYVNTVPSNTGGTPITGATNKTFNPGSANIGVWYYYCVITGCNTQESDVSGSYTIGTPATINLTSAPATATQSFCLGVDLTDITIAIGGAGTGADVSSGSLPAGVTGVYNGGVYTISGTPAAAGVYSFNISPTGPICNNLSLSFSITVKDTAIGTLVASEASGTPNDDVICPGSTVNFEATAGYPNYNFKINGTSVQNGTGRTFSYNAFANGDVVTVDVTHPSGCVATFNAITITVEDFPSGTLIATENSGTPNDNSICSGANVTFTATPGYNTYQFKVDGVTVQTGTANIYATTSLTGAPSVTVIVTGAGGCQNTWGPEVITVGTTPLGNITVSETSGLINNDNIICAGDEATFTATAGFANYEFVVNGITGQNGASNIFSSTTLTNPSIVTVNATSAQGCTGIFGPVVVGVNDLPSGNLTATENSGMPNDNIICQGASIEFTATSGYDHYNFKVNGVSVQSSAGNTFATSGLNNGDVVSVEVTSDEGCSSVFNTITVTVTALPGTGLSVTETSGNTNDDGIICAGASVTFTAEAGHVNYKFYVNNVLTMAGTGNSFTTASLANGDEVYAEILDANGCIVVTSSAVIIVEALPTGNITLAETSGNAHNDNVICTGATATFTATTGYAQYKFMVNGVPQQTGASNQYITTTLNNNDVVTVEATNAAGCSKVFNNIVVTVHSLPTGTLQASENSGTADDDIICPNETVTFTATAGMSNYNFKVDGISKQSSASNLYIATDISITSSVEVDATNANGCVSTFNPIVITVLPAPAGTLTATENSGIAPNDNQICTGATVTFTATSGYQLYTFKVNGIDVQTGRSNTYATNTLADGDEVTVFVHSSNGCTLEYNSIIISVFDYPVQQPITGVMEVCVGATVTLQNANSGGVWSSSNTGAADVDAATGVVTGISAGVVTITYAATNVNGCTTISTTSFEVHALPTPTLTGPNPFCPGTVADYFTEAGQSNYMWTVTGGTIVAGGTSTDDFIQVDWNLPGVKSIFVNYTNANGCAGATSTTVTGSTGTIPVISGPNVVCNLSTGNVYTTQSGQTDYIWNVTGGTITGGGTLNDDDVTITWTTPGTGKVMVNFTDINGCSAAAQTVYSVTVRRLPAAGIGGTTFVCKDAAMPNVSFNGSLGKAPYTFTYNINGGASQTVSTVSGNSITVPVPTNVPGTFIYNLEYISDDNGCGQTQSGSVTVTVNPLPAASISGTTEVCQSGVAPVVFTGSNGTAPYTFKYRINGGGLLSITAVSGNSVSLNANTSVAGVFEYTLVSVMDANGCSFAIADTATVTVNPLPNAAISGTASVCIHSTEPEITFTGSNGTAPYTFYYKLNGGAVQSVVSVGNTAIVSVPTNATGTFIYTLQSVTDASSTTCSRNQSGTATITVTAASVGGSLSGSTSVCTGTNSATMNLSGRTGNIVDWEYSTDGGVTWNAIGHTAVSYTATNLIQTTQYRVVVKSGNCDVAYSSVATITVLPVSVGGTVSSDATICANINSGTLTLSGHTGNVVRWESSVNNGVSWTNISNTTTSLNYTNLIQTTWYRAIVANSPCSQIASSVAVITVNPRPTGVISGTTAICTGGSANLTLTVTGSGTISGTVTGGISFSGTAPIITLPVSPVSNTTYTITSLSDDYCVSLPANLSGSAVVSVNPLPGAFTISPSPVTMCEGTVTALTANGGAPIPGSKSASSGNINQAIPDKTSGGTTGVRTHNLTISGIPGNAVITGIIVTFKITHTATGDLNINLKAPNGNILNLVNQRGGTGDHFNVTNISSASATPITSGSNPYNGTYAADAKNNIGTPANVSNVTNFSSLYGTPNGTYTFIVEDDVYRRGGQTNTGTLNNWSIEVQYSVPATFNCVWSPITGLFSDPGATTAYAGEPLTNVYASPAAGAHTYTATYTNNNGCQNSTGVNVTVNAAPVVEISADYCSIPGKVALTATSTPAATGYLWSTGETTQTIEVDEVGVYDVIVSSPLGCPGMASLGVAQELVVNGDFEQGNVGFFTEYAYATGYNLWPEGEYAVDNDAHLYHTNFYGKDHTTPAQTGKFMMINGSTNKIGNPPRYRIIWQQTVTVLPNTDYYFSAWGMNLNPAAPAKLQFEINGVPVGTIADLDIAPKPTSYAQVNINNWKRFYSNPTWNSGNNTTAVIRIINLNTIAGGNDFGLDDISFGTLRPFINLISAPGTDDQTVCANAPLTQIVYAAASGATGPVVTGLPTGVTSVYTGTTLTISGTPTVAGIYNYSVSTTGGCNPVTVTGTITVQEQTISLASGSSALTVCKDGALTSIQFTLGGTATGATVAGLPAGVTGMVSGSTLTISGTPTVTGIFNYTVTTSGNCTPATTGGSIEVKAQTISLFSGSATQTRCVNTAIGNIIYQIGGMATGASVTGLPTGVTGTFSGGLFVISGTPTVAGTYNYTVTTSGSCNPVSIGGTLTINPAASILLTSGAGSDQPVLCVNTLLTDITYAVSGGGTGANVTGLPAGLTGTYSSGVFTISGTPTAIGTFNYTVHTTGTCAQTTANGIITVQGATVTLSSGLANQSVCNQTPISNVVFTIGGTATGATVTGLPNGVTGTYSGGLFTISGTPTEYGTFNYVITSTGTCAGATGGGVLTVGIGSVGGTLPDAYVCNHSGGVIMLAGYNGNVVRWESSTNGGATWSNIANVTDVHTFSNITSTVLYRVMVKQGSCPAVYSDTAMVSTLNTWTGVVSNDWFTAANWSNNTLPSLSCADVIIPVVNAPAVYPEISTGTASVKNIIIHSGASLTVDNATFEIAGTITNSGSFDASNGTIHLNGTVAQNVPAGAFLNNNVNHLLLGNSSASGVTLDGELNILGSVNFSQTGTKLQTNGYLTLRSTEANTAWVGNLTGKVIQGDVTVERYIRTGTTPGAHPKSWQLLAVPVKGSQTINQAWQEGSTYANQNLRPGYGTMITSKIPGAVGLGFDVYTPAGGTMNKYNAATNEWVGVPSTLSTPIENVNGYMVLVRGDRSVITASAPANASTLRAKGKLYTPGADAPPRVYVPGGKFETVGNPYASAIDLTSGGVTTHHLADVFYLWDPQLTNQGINSAYGLGAYQTLTKGMDGNYHVTPGGGSYGAPGSVVNTIESGQAFFVLAPTQTGHIDFKESAKVAGSNLRARTSLLAESEIRTNLYVMSNGYQVLLDGVATQFNDLYDNEVTIDDAVKLGNLSETFSLRRAQKLFAVEKRKPVTENDTIYFNLGLMRQQSYVLEINPANMETAGVTAWLEDAYLQTSTEVSLETSTSYPFNVVTSAPTSYAANRFRIVFRRITSEEPEVLLITATATRNENGPVQITWNVLNETGVAHYEIERSTDAVRYTGIITREARANNGGQVRYTDVDHSPVVSEVYYLIKAVMYSGKVFYSKRMVVKPGRQEPAEIVTVYPNPVMGRQVNVRLENMEAGKYKVSLFNHSGVLVMDKDEVIKQRGVTLRYPVPGLTPGSYRLVVYNAAGKKWVQQIVIL